MIINDQQRPPKDNQGQPVTPPHMSAGHPIPRSRMSRLWRLVTIVCALVLLTACSEYRDFLIEPTPTAVPFLFAANNAIATATTSANPQAIAAAYVARGDQQASAGVYAAAIADYTYALSLTPQDARIYNNRALAYQAGGAYQAALADLETAIQIDPTYLRAYQNQAAIWEQIGGDPRRRAATYGRIAELAPDLAASYRYQQGLLLEQLKEPNAALQAYDAALTADPTHANAHYQRAVLHYAARRYSAALSDLDAAIAQSPLAANAYYVRAMVYNASGDHAAAIADLGQVLALEPGNAEALLARAAIRAETGDTNGATSDIQRLETMPLDDDLAAALQQLRLTIEHNMTRP